MNKPEETDNAHRLGFMWYYDEWWSSKTFFKLRKNERIRYLYLELISLLNKGKGVWEEDREFLSGFLFVDISNEEWSILRGIFTIETDAENRVFWSHPAVDKRRGPRTKKQREAARENGKNGGRPASKNNPRETQEKPDITQEPGLININTKESKETETNRKLVSVELQRDEHTPTLNPLGVRFSVEEFEKRFRTFSEEERKVFSGVWNKLTDKETQDAAYFYGVELHDTKSKKKTPPRIIKFIEAKRWEYWIKKFAKIEAKKQKS